MLAWSGQRTKAKGGKKGQNDACRQCNRYVPSRDTSPVWCEVKSGGYANVHTGEP